MIRISQSEIEELLKKNKSEWFTTKKIADILEINESSCSNNLKRMGGSIRRRINQDDSRIGEYSYKEHETMLRRNPNIERLLMEDKENGNTRR